MKSWQGAGDPPEPEERPAARFPLRGAVSFRSGRVGGDGRVRDLSATGALIERPSCRLATGTRVELALTINGDQPPVRLTGVVVRQTNAGFGVEFLDGHDQVKRAMDVALCAAGGSVKEEEQTQPIVDET